MREFSPSKKFIALGLATGLGLSACGGAQHTIASTKSSEAKIASRFNDLSTSNVPIVPAENANFTKKVTRTLPDGTQVEVMISSLGVNGTGTNRQLEPSKVDGIDIIVYPKGATVGQVKPDFGLDLGQEVNGTWDATYYQFLKDNQPYQVGEMGYRTVQTANSPGNVIPASKDNSTEARSIYKQIVDESELIFNAFAKGHNLAGMPDIQR